MDQGPLENLHEVLAHRTARSAETLRITARAKQLRELGMSDKAIGRAIGVGDKTVVKAIASLGG